MKHFTTISDFHQSLKLPNTQHPLISVIDVAALPPIDGPEQINMVLDFYAISVIRSSNLKATYGQHPFDFNEGVLSFIAPKQVFSIALAKPDEEVLKSGWVICIHPDFIWNTSLAKTITGYDFWDYSLHESLFLSATEEAIMTVAKQTIQQEVAGNHDRFSKPIIIAHLETLLNYADRFYHRQFITREKVNHQILECLENLLADYFRSDGVVEKGLPTVKYMADQMNLSPKYLSNVLRMLTGQNTQQHIHDKLIERAKEKLSTTNLTVSEIAYELGFAYLASFSRFFKARTNQSPLAFRASFN